MVDTHPRIPHAIFLAFRQFVPQTNDREELTWHDVPQAMLFLVPYIFMAYLVRRRDTHVMRLLLLPTIIAMTLRCTFRYHWKDSRFRWFEWVRGTVMRIEMSEDANWGIIGLVGLVVIAKSIDFALTREGRFKVGEKELPAIAETKHNSPQHQRANIEKEAFSTDHEDRGMIGNLLPRALYDALEIGLAMRGVGWDFGKSLPTTGKPPSERNAFMIKALWRLARNVLYIDIWDTIQKSTPGVSSTGGTIFLYHLPYFHRYTYSTLLHLGHGLLIAAGVSCVYDIFSLVGVLLCGSVPHDWPLVSGDMWTVRSLHQFWSKGWHQSLRYIFLIYGGFPGKRLAGSVGMIFGTFLASALFHEIGIVTTGEAMDSRVFLFFILQGLGISVEKGFAKLTGRRVGGKLGFTWTAIFVLGFGQMCTDSWFNRGIGGAIAVPLPDQLRVGRKITLLIF